MSGSAASADENTYLGADSSKSDIVLHCCASLLDAKKAILSSILLFSEVRICKNAPKTKLAEYDLLHGPNEPVKTPQLKRFVDK